MTMNQPSATGTPRGNTAAVLALATGLHTMSAMQVFTIPSIAPTIAAGLGASEAFVGVLLILVYSAALVVSLFAGSFVTRVGAVRVAQLSMVLGTVGLGLAAIPFQIVVALGAILLGASYGLVCCR